MVRFQAVRRTFCSRWRQLAQSLHEQLTALQSQPLRLRLRLLLLLLLLLLLKLKLVLEYLPLPLRSRVHFFALCVRIETPARFTGRRRRLVILLRMLAALVFLFGRGRRGGLPARAGLKPVLFGPRGHRRVRTGSRSSAAVTLVLLLLVVVAGSTLVMRLRRRGRT